MSVSFHKDCLEMSEWYMCQPTVKRGSPRDSESIVNAKVIRHADYYVDNIVVVMFSLSFISLVVFATDPIEIKKGVRATMLITLLLTMVALKFTVSDALPNVPYDTPIDVCFNSCFRTLAFIIFISVIPQYFEFIEVDTEVYYVHPMQIANIVCAAVSLITVVITTYRWFSENRIANYLHRADAKKVHLMENSKNFYTYRYHPAPIFLNEETMISDPIVRSRLMSNQRAAKKSIYRFVT
jgi:hypothetical protein